MPKFEFEWHSLREGIVEVTAETVEEAEDKFSSGEYDPETEDVWGGDIDVDKVTELK